MFYILGISLILLLVLVGIVGPYSSAVPVGAQTMLLGVYLQVWMRRHRFASLLDIGFLAVTATYLYCAIPPLMYWLSGESFTLLSDNRLYWASPTRDEVLSIFWWETMYLGVLVATNLAFRTKEPVVWRRVEFTYRSVILPVAVLICVLGAFLMLVQMLYGITLNPSYDDLRSGAVETVESLPLVMRQFTSNANTAVFVLKLALLIALLNPGMGNRKRGGAIVVIWVAIEVAMFLTRFGSRYETTLLILATVLLWDRFRGRLTITALSAFGSFMILGFMAIGVLRDAAEDVNSRSAAEFIGSNPSNEFQAMFATAFDLKRRFETGAVAEAPPQLRFSELYWGIPSQLLPFDKVDPSEWYLEIIGLKGMGVGFMFGVVPQSLIGFGLTELLARGAILGVLFARMHGFYLRHSHKASVTCGYLWISLFSYYTFRQNTFSIFSTFVVRCLPVLVLLGLLYNSKRILDPTIERDQGTAY